jgi:hypothetical protein
VKHFFDAFKLHDQEGMPLTVGIGAARANGMEINLASFFCDAMEAGWTKERTLAVIAAACADNGGKFSEQPFMQKVSELWTLAGSLSDPVCWPEMKKRISQPTIP